MIPAGRPRRTPRRTTHQPTNIRWEPLKTQWTRPVPVIHGVIASSRANVAPHEITGRLDGTLFDCPCPACALCTIERHGLDCVAAYWRQVYAESPDELRARDKDLALQNATCGLDEWMRIEWDCVGNLIAELYEREAA